MGTSLTGLTPATTYDALIKVTDNGSLSATAKYLSDGLGNDSVLALSTSRVGINTTSPAYKLDVSTASGEAYIRVDSAANQDGGFRISEGGTNKWLLYNVSASDALSIYDNTATAERMRIASNGNVTIKGPTASNGGVLNLENTTTAVNGSDWGSIKFISNDSSTSASGIRASIVGTSTSFNGDGNIVFSTAPSNGVNTERMRILATGGLTFNGDTAAANALDDYEEGTFSPFITFGGGSTGITYANRAGSYTKIGNQVTVNMYIELTNKGSDTGQTLIGGLPFTIGNGASRYGAISLWINTISYANQIFGRYVINTSTFLLTETTEAGVTTSIDNTNFSNISELMVTATYFI